MSFVDRDFSSVGEIWWERHAARLCSSRPTSSRAAEFISSHVIGVNRCTISRPGKMSMLDAPKLSENSSVRRSWLEYSGRRCNDRQSAWRYDESGTPPWAVPWSRRYRVNTQWHQVLQSGAMKAHRLWAEKIEELTSLRNNLTSERHMIVVSDQHEWRESLRMNRALSLGSAGSSGT